MPKNFVVMVTVRSPNDQMGAANFFNGLFLALLVHPRHLVHEPDQFVPQFANGLLHLFLFGKRQKFAGVKHLRGLNEKTRKIKRTKSVFLICSKTEIDRPSVKRAFADVHSIPFGRVGLIVVAEEEGLQLLKSLGQVRDQVFHEAPYHKVGLDTKN